MAPILVHEDVYLRGRKFFDQKIVAPPAKGELTSQELCIPPSVHADPVLKPAIHFYSQQAILRLKDDKKSEPSRLTRSQSDSNLAPRPRKEMIDLGKYYKQQVKGAEKRTVQFLKQLEKSEAKQAKRDMQMEKITDLETQIKDQLKEVREYSKKYELFAEKYITGSKFGDKCPGKNVWIIAETSEITGPYVNNMIDEITKFVQTCITNSCESFNMAMFGGDTWVTWSPSYLDPNDAKKGAADSIKWITKTLTTKKCAETAFPPNWVEMFEKCFAEGFTNPKLEPSSIYVACSRPPQDDESLVEAMKGKSVPIHCVAFDEELEGDDDVKKFFESLCGEKSTFQVDTSQRDLNFVDKSLTEIKTKKKNLDKLNNQLSKMEDLTDTVKEHEKLLANQISLENFLRNEVDVCEADSKNEDLQRDTRGNLVLPDDVVENMRKLGKKVQC